MVPKSIPKMIREFWRVLWLAILLADAVLRRRSSEAAGGVGSKEVRSSGKVLIKRAQPHLGRFTDAEVRRSWSGRNVPWFRVTGWSEGPGGAGEGLLLGRWAANRPGTEGQAGMPNPR